MKKTLTKVLATVLACGLMFTATACGGKNNDNAGKTAIKTSFFIGEFGDEWIKSVARDWNKTNDKFYVEVKNTLNLGDTFTGYFLHALLCGQPPEEALRVASAASAVMRRRIRGDSASGVSEREAVETETERVGMTSGV